ncbi:MAG: LytTR family DNA-binding domain-containing protein [Dyadobacter sp.]|uniref:LytR/AlgR family response regulator transcription factor n=1 Tax=Dyadobacter sp. TaxID=1914288 RepID=UPI003267D58C
MISIRIVVVEDEAATARNLVHFLTQTDQNIKVVTVLGTVAGAVEWFEANQDAYELIFMDIRLADGLSFDIFKQTRISRPVIFVTAYNDYAIAAFKNNGIDYILKPFDPAEIERALGKYKNWMAAPEKKIKPVFDDLLAQLGSLTKSFKKSFLVHYRGKLFPLETAKIAWFYTAAEVVYARTVDEKQYIVEFTMEQLEQQLDPDSFCRVNRQFIINRLAVTEAEQYFNGRLLVKVTPQADEHIIISKARTAEFKNWMNR